MESLVVYTESAEQLKTVKAVLKALKVQFEPQAEVFPQHLLKSIEISRKQHENGETISLQEFKEKHLCKSDIRNTIFAGSRNNFRISYYAASTTMGR